MRSSLTKTKLIAPRNRLNYRDHPVSTPKLYKRLPQNRWPILPLSLTKCKLFFTSTLQFIYKVTLALLRSITIVADLVQPHASKLGRRVKRATIDEGFVRQATLNPLANVGEGSGGHTASTSEENHNHPLDVGF